MKPEKEELSPTMKAALQMATDHDGKLVRYPGGYWSYFGVSMSTGRPDQYHGTTTIEALVARGKMRYSAWQQNKNGEFPIEAAI